MSKYKALIFDADDTLFDFQAAERIALEMTLNAYDLPYNSAVHLCYKQISKGLWSDLEKGLVTQEILKYQRFEELFAIQNWNANVTQIADSYLENLSNQGILIEGALELVKELSQRYELYIITNGITSVQKGRFEHSPIMGFIKAMVISEEAGINKPDPKIFDYFNAMHGPFERSQLLMIGDSLSSDILGGINYGIDTCWFNPKGEVAKEVVPTFEVATFEALYMKLENEPLISSHCCG